MIELRGSPSLNFILLFLIALFFFVVFFIIIGLLILVLIASLIIFFLWLKRFLSCLLLQEEIRKLIHIAYIFKFQITHHRLISSKVISSCYKSASILTTFILVAGSHSLHFNSFTSLSPTCSSLIFIERSLVWRCIVNFCLRDWVILVKVRICLV